MRRHFLPLNNLLGLAAALAASGCATGLHEINNPPQAARLEQTLAHVITATNNPDVHYWVRASEPDKHNIGLGVLFQRHIYIAQPLLEQVDDTMLAAILLHGVAHHRLHHLGQRSGILTLQGLVFKVGGAFVPGLSYGKYAGDPLSEVAMGSWQEPAADAKTVEYLRELGHSGSEWLKALEFFRDHGYAERVGRATMRKRDFTGRIARLQNLLAGGESAQATPAAQEAQAAP